MTISRLVMYMEEWYELLHPASQLVTGFIWRLMGNHSSRATEGTSLMESRVKVTNNNYITTDVRMELERDFNMQE